MSKVKATTKNSHFLKIDFNYLNCEEIQRLVRYPAIGIQASYIFYVLCITFANFEGRIAIIDSDNNFVSIDDDYLYGKVASDIPSVPLETFKLCMAAIRKCNLTYIDSHGYERISGMKLTGDPLEPTLHLANNKPSGKYIYQPLSIEPAVSKEDYRKRRQRFIAGNADVLPISANNSAGYLSYDENGEDTYSYAEIVELIQRRLTEDGYENLTRRVRKQRVSDYINQQYPDEKSKWIARSGQKSRVPEPIVKEIIEYFATKIEPN